MFWTYLGAALILLVIGQLALSLLAGLQRERADALRQSLEIAQLKEELATLRETRHQLADRPFPWNGVRKFVVQRRVIENSDVRSFYLVPHDARPLPTFKPGQYLTFQLPHPQGSGQLVRCYSLSDRPHAGHYRVTIKRMTGLGSGLFHSEVQEGDILDVRAPAGNFFLEPTDPEPVVLVAGGIGLTPVLSMLHTLVHQQSRREIWFFYGVRHGGDHLFRKELAEVTRDNPNIQLRICYSQPRPDDREGEDYQIRGRVTIELLRAVLPSNNYRFYYCGPGPMMEALTKELRQWGVPEAHLHYETFGASSVKQVSRATSGLEPVRAARCQVSFRKSGRTLAWSEGSGSLLELAESAGIAIPSGCRAGHCGTCVVAMQSGEVGYVQPPGLLPEARTCLTCIAQPSGDVVLDA
ncbi:MAG: 2Fe-2S iron-sulfur cluster-binding protein [bacterium]|nr:2Fe-2S iron-sulfur cluster-binding protein [bacterium]